MRLFSAAGLVVVLCLANWPSVTTAQGLPTWLGKAVSAATAQGNGAAVNPFQLLGSLSKLPSQEQHMLLALVGETLKEETGMQCNVFGGSAACVSVPQHSRVADLCKDEVASQSEVDCVASLGLEEAPDSVAELEGSLDRLQLRDMREECPQCLTNLRATVCAQKLPPCGAFDAAITAVLPALQKISDAMGRGKAPGEALASVVPQLLDQLALTLPCREQCEATVDSCSCADHELTLGEVLDDVLATRGEDLPVYMQMGLFSRLHDRRLCDLFAPKNATGFVGTCQDLPATCSQEKKWCTGGSSHAVVEQQLAVHLAQTLFGFATFLNGGAVDKVVHTANLPQPDIAQLEKKYVADHPQAVPTELGGGGSGGFWRGALAALVTVAAVASLGGVAWVATAQWRQEHLAEWTGKTAGYQPMMPTDEGQEL